MNEHESLCEAVRKCLQDLGDIWRSIEQCPLHSSILVLGTMRRLRGILDQYTDTRLLSATAEEALKVADELYENLKG